MIVVYKRPSIYRLLVYGDTSTIRVQLCVASILFAFGTIPDRYMPYLAFDLFGHTVVLLQPLHTFARPTYAGMAELMPDGGWCLAFLSHAIGVIWRLTDPVPRIWWAFGINAWGLAIWIVSTGLINAQVGEFSPGTGMEVAMILAAFIALIRTGLNDEKTTP